jgi:hypothetical protein
MVGRVLLIVGLSSAGLYDTNSLKRTGYAD